MRWVEVLPDGGAAAAAVPPADAGVSPAVASSLADRLKQLTGIVAAATALIAGITALVVAMAAGWKQVGPYFDDLVRHGETRIPAAPKPSPTPVPARADPLYPGLLAALDAADAGERRRARAALATAVAGAAPRGADALVDRLATSTSYRTQLGIAVALHRAPGGWRATDPAAAAARLRAMAAKTRDATLRAELAGAAAAVRP